MSTALLIGSVVTVRPYADLIEKLSVRTVVRENFNQALAEADTLHPGVIAIILPQYFESVTAFIEELRRKPSLRSTPIVYIGGMIEGSDQSVLHNLGVKTLTLGPVPSDEMARFIVRQIQ